jgi:sugar lactone lactonase YvrE
MEVELIFMKDFLHFPEGPRFDDEGNLYFGDALDNGFYRFSKAKGVEEIDSLASGVGGVVIHQDGGVIYSGRQGMMHYQPRSGAIRRVDALWETRPLTGVNDIEADRFGNLYGGTLDFDAFDKGVPPQPGFLFRLNVDGSLTRLRNVGISNGIAFSPLGESMYFSESGEGVFSYDLSESGNVTNRQLFAGLDDSDGIAVDLQGGVWVARYLNNHIKYFNTNGDLIQEVPTPFENVTSVTFGGKDMKELYITGGTLGIKGKGGLAKLTVEIAGMKSHKTSVAILDSN